MTRERQTALRRATDALEGDAAASWVRLGDGELDYLLKVQAERAEDIRRHPDTLSLEVAHCCPGLGVGSYERLLRAYEQASMVDLHDHLAFNQEHLPRLSWRPRPDQVQFSGGEESGLMMDWCWEELPGWLERHACVICGAEAGLLRELLVEPGYREVAGRFWDRAKFVHFVEPVGGGLDLSVHLDAIAEQLVEAVQAHHCDTLLLALGGAAKILAVELSSRLGVRAIDIGSVLRALCGAGSAGHASWRASHSPFYFHVPLAVFLAALDRWRPRMPEKLRLLKAQSQLCWDLQRKDRNSTVSDVIDVSSFDPSAQNMRWFRADFRTYRRSCEVGALLQPACWGSVLAFRGWLTRKGLLWHGRLAFRLRGRRPPGE